jgi:protein-S-isoprenylcysteine O-methyltransferase Ste14
MIKFIINRVAQNIMTLAALGVLFFVLSGTLKILGFWIYVATVLAYQIISLLIIVPRHPEYIKLAEVRRIRHSGAKPWDRTLMTLMMAVTYLMYCLAALDVGHWHINQASAAFLPVGILFYVAGSALNQWAMLNNPHFESEVRIQTDRGHAVMTTGPYRYIRHPGYLGSVLGFLSFPLLIGSTVGLAASLLCILGMIIRTFLEDRVLLQELAGYTDYARAVRWRLIPYLW